MIDHVQLTGEQAVDDANGAGGNAQFTASGVTVSGGALNVPVATNWTVLFCPTDGLIEIDCRTRLEPPPQLSSEEKANNKGVKRIRRINDRLTLHILNAGARIKSL